MPSLEELKRQIAELQQQATEMHERESAEAIATVKDLVARYGLTAEQVGFGAAAKAARKTAKTVATKSTRPGAGVPKYADPVSGKTWTGFGKPPAWIAGSADRSAFLIDGAPPPTVVASRKSAAKKGVASKAVTGRATPAKRSS